MKSLLTIALCISVCTGFAITGNQNSAQSENEPNTSQQRDSLTVPDEVDPNSVKYRRSSLYTIMLDNQGLPHFDSIKETFLTTAIPDKFNDHNLSDRIVFDLSAYIVAASDTLAVANSEGKDKNDKKIGSKIASAYGFTGVTNTGLSKEEIEARINAFVSTQSVAKQLVAKWFNRDSTGAFNTELIQERGFYDASAIDISTANNTTRGINTLADAGEELISNTFVLISSFKFTDKEEIAATANRAVKTAGTFLKVIPGAGTAVSAAETGATTASTIAGKGYVVKTTSYLFKLKWTDSIAAVFYNDYWVNPGEDAPAKVKAFDESEIFELELIGSEIAWAGVQSSIFSDKKDEELVRKATVNALDAVIAKLQRKHEQFRTKTPLYSADPITAKIGLKEGLEAGDKYDVLEQTIDKNGKTVYKTIGSLTVDKKQIWDNRYGANIENPDQEIDATLFKGSGKKLYPGVLIKQSK